MRARTLTWLALTLASTAHAAELRTAPFLQSATPTSVWVVWETEGDGASSVRFGPDAALGADATATSRPTADGGFLHEAQLTGLTPGSRVHYQAVTGDLETDVARLVTPPGPDGTDPFRLVAMSDMQRSSRDPDKFREVVVDGILAWADDQPGDDVADQFAMVLIPGDLVDDGDDYEQWETEFFGPIAPLVEAVPVYPVLGNHEKNTHWYFDYFHLPEDAPAGLEERFWSTRYGNLLVVGLDSNHVASWATQLDWLDAKLDGACDDDSVDFVFAELHHPFQSELWTPGNLPFTGQLIERLEAFSTACGKPSVHFFGHTHAYSRGQTRDHRHLMVNVASAGGALDIWGEQDQFDYAPFSVSEDDWGFVVVDVSQGDDAALRLRRYSRGDGVTPLDNELLDEIEIPRVATPPCTPVALVPPGPIDGACVTVRSTPMEDPDAQAHQATHWQLARTCNGFDAPVHDVWRQDENRYFGVDTQEGDDLTDEAFQGLDAGDWCVRVRHRDAGLAWSDWSDGVPFTVEGLSHSPDLIDDTEATGLLGWSVTAGRAESAGDARCGTKLPVDGAHAMALGGACTTELPATVERDVDLTAWTDAVDGTTVRLEMAVVGTVDVALVFLDAFGAEIGRETGTFEGDGDWAWSFMTGTAPERAVDVRVVLMSEALAQVDDVRLTLGASDAPTCATATDDEVAAALAAAGCEDAAPTDDDDDPTEAVACTGCAGGGAAGGWLVALAAVGLTRRRRA